MSKLGRIYALALAMLLLALIGTTCNNTCYTAQTMGAEKNSKKILRRP